MSGGTGGEDSDSERRGLIFTPAAGCISNRLPPPEKSTMNINLIRIQSLCTYLEVDLHQIYYRCGERCGWVAGRGGVAPVFAIAR